MRMVLLLSSDLMPVTLSAPVLLVVGITHGGERVRTTDSACPTRLDAWPRTSPRLATGSGSSPRMSAGRAADAPTPLRPSMSTHGCGRRRGRACDAAGQCRGAERRYFPASALWLARDGGTVRALKRCRGPLNNWSRPCLAPYEALLPAVAGLKSPSASPLARFRAQALLAVGGRSLSGLTQQWKRSLAARWPTSSSGVSR